MAAVKLTPESRAWESLAKEAPLHTCPKCKTEWDDEILVCPEDGTRLPPASKAVRTPPPAPAKRAPSSGASKAAAPSALPTEANDGATQMLVLPRTPAAAPAPKAAPTAPPDDGSTQMLVVARKPAPVAAAKPVSIAAAKPIAKAQPLPPAEAATMMMAGPPRELGASSPPPAQNPDATQMLSLPRSAPAAPKAPLSVVPKAAAPAVKSAPIAAAAGPVPTTAKPAPPPPEPVKAAEPEPEEEEYDELIGLQVGSYRVIRLLGRGGMGAVYLAEHPVIHSRVAIKFLHPQFSENKKIVDRFFNEARAVNLIGHDNILKILDLNATEDGRHYFVMELLEGQALQALVEPGLPVPLSVSGPILLQFCEALQAAHDRRIFHRDVKPDNVYLVSHKGRKNFVKVVDFGIAKLTEPGPGQSGTGTTQTGMVVGTPAYMSPEQAAGVHNKIDGRSDVYSTGVMMFQLATGKLPFPSANFGEVLIGHMRLDPPRPRELNPEIPLEYEQIILTALAKSQESRQQSMRELEQQISEVMKALQISKELPIADEISGSPDMVRLNQGDTPISMRRKAERPKFREAEIAGKASGPLRKSGQTLATRLAPAPTSIQDNPLRRAPEPPPASPLRWVALGLGALVLLGLVSMLSVYLFRSADPTHRRAKHSDVVVTNAPVTNEPLGPTLLSVVSDPLGATVDATWKDGGNKKGLTPLDIRVPRDTKVTLVFSLSGYAPYRQDVIADESQVVTAQMQKDGNGRTQVVRRPRNPDEVIDVKDQMK